MSQTQNATHITAISRMIVTVADQDKAVDFYCGKLGLEKITDVPYGNGERWVEVAVAGTSTPAIALVTPMGSNTPGGNSGVILSSNNLDADHADLKARGVDVDAEIMRGGDPVPPMFWFRDQDANVLLIVGEPQG